MPFYILCIAKKTFVTNNGVQKQHVWTEKIGQKNKFGEPIIMESVDKLHQFVQSRLINLKFLTDKGV